MTRRFSILLFACASMLASMATAACGSSVVDKPAETAASQQAITTTSEHGPVRVLADALGSVSLRPSQRTEIQKLFAEADARHTAAKAQSKTGRADLLNALAAQVEQGRVDRAALAPKEQALDAAWKTSRDADRAALEKLHALLDPAQRTALIDAIQLTKHDDASAGDGGRGDRGESKRHGGWGRGRGRGKHHRGHDRFAKLGEDLKLTDDQKAKLFEALRAERGKDRPNHPPHTKLEAIFTAFKSDHFKMDEVAPQTELHEPLARTLRLTEITVPLLTPEQRATLAAKIRERAKHAD
ncbi:hypothetical protein [Pendulispora albinea]|uniref:Uncharacterized protein n=1 Tax=Pendulispora albinea TaxID=2741071 RepID=A0ABZ2M060_9BACT